MLSDDCSLFFKLSEQLRNSDKDTEVVIAVALRAANAPIVSLSHLDKKRFLMSAETPEHTNSVDGVEVLILKQRCFLRRYHAEGSRTFYIANTGVFTAKYVAKSLYTLFKKKYRFSLQSGVHSLIKTGQYLAVLVKAPGIDSARFPIQVLPRGKWNRIPV